MCEKSCGELRGRGAFSLTRAYSILSDAVYIESGSTVKVLVEAVNALMKQGWQPQGGVTFRRWSFEGTTYDEFIQAMIREKP